MHQQRISMLSKNVQTPDPDVYAGEEPRPPCVKCQKSCFFRLSVLTQAFARIQIVQADTQRPRPTNETDTMLRVLHQTAALEAATAGAAVGWPDSTRLRILPVQHAPV